MWDTADTDPGQSLQNALVLGGALVAWSGDRVASYRLSDGQRLWQQLLPAGAGFIFDVAGSGTSVVVAYDDRLRALSATNGSQLWSLPGIVSSQLVVADGWVYTNNGAGVSRYALATGNAGWSVLAGQDIYRIEAADADTVYVWEAFFDFGPPAPSVLHALNASNGSQRWEHNVPSRIGSVAVVGDVVWLTSTEIFSQGRGSDLIALRRDNGDELRRVHFDDNVYGWTDVAFGAGKVVLHQGGSFGGSTPATMRVFGLAGPRPTITTKVLPMARVGAPYGHQLEATVASGSVQWTVQGGALPAGLALSPARASAATRPERSSHRPRSGRPARTGAHNSAPSRCSSSPRRPRPGSPQGGTRRGTRSSPATAASTSTTRPRSGSAGRRHRQVRPSPAATRTS